MAWVFARPDAVVKDGSVLVHQSPLVGQGVIWGVDDPVPLRVTSPGRWSWCVIGQRIPMAVGTRVVLGAPTKTIDRAVTVLD